MSYLDGPDGQVFFADSRYSRVRSDVRPVCKNQCPLAVVECAVAVRAIDPAVELGSERLKRSSRTGNRQERLGTEAGHIPSMVDPPENPESNSRSEWMPTDAIFDAPSVPRRITFAHHG